MLVKQQIQAMNDLSEALETKAPASKVAEIQQRLNDTNKKIADLKLTDDAKKKLAERHKDEMNVAVTRLTKAGFNKAFGDLGDVNNPFGNIAIGPNAKGVLAVKETQDLLIDKWIIGNSVVEFRTDGTLPQLGLTAPTGVYEWYAQTSVTLRQANMPGKTLEVVIQGDDLTLKSANAEVYRGKRWTVEGQRKLDDTNVPEKK